MLLDVDFSLGRGLRKSFPLLSSSSPSLPLRASTLPSHYSPLTRHRSLGRVARSATALPIGADTPRGVGADFSLLGGTRSSSVASVCPSVRPFAGHPPLRWQSSIVLIEAACVRACTSCCSVQSFLFSRPTNLCFYDLPRFTCPRSCPLNRPNVAINR